MSVVGIDMTRRTHEYRPGHYWYCSERAAGYWAGWFWYPCLSMKGSLPSTRFGGSQSHQPDYYDDFIRLEDKTSYGIYAITKSDWNIQSWLHGWRTHLLLHTLVQCYFDGKDSPFDVVLYISSDMLKDKPLCTKEFPSEFVFNITSFPVFNATGHVLKTI